jgi:hypothetical protein
MKYACLTSAAVVAVLAGIVLVATQPAAGQVAAPAAPNPVLRPPAQLPDGAIGPVVQYQHQPVVTYHTTPYAAYGSAQDPELSKLVSEEAQVEQETAVLIAEYSRSEDEPQRTKTKAKLAATLEKQFDLQQKRRDLEVARIEAQLKKLRDIMRKRGESRQSIIDKRLDQLLREADGLGWTPPHGTPVPGAPTALYVPQSVPAPRGQRSP